MDDEEALFADFENYNNGNTKRRNVNNLPPWPLRSQTPPQDPQLSLSGSKLTLMVPLSRVFRSGGNAAGLEAEQGIYHDYRKMGKMGVVMACYDIDEAGAA